MPSPAHHDSVTHEVARAIKRRFWSQIRWFHRLKRWQRWLVRVALATPLLALLLFLLVARSPATRLLLIPRLESALNLRITADSVFMRADGKVQINRAVFFIPGVDGPAGQLLRVGRLVATVDWAATATGSPTVSRIELEDAVVRVSQSIDDGSLSIASFNPPGPRGGPPRPGRAPRLELPTIIATRAAIELGEHSGTMYSSLKRLPVEGVLRPSPEGPDAGYMVSLRETPTIPRPEGEGFVLNGDLKNDDVRLVMDNFRLDAWPASAVPSPSRQLFTDLGLQGNVDKLIFTYTAADGVSAQLLVDDVAMSLPIAPSDPQYTEGQPLRMVGVSGAVTFTRDSLSAKIRGVLEDLPYEVTLVYDGVTEDAPFTCEFVSKGFRVEKYPKLLPYANRIVRKRLATFSGPTATIDTRLILRRGAPLAPGRPAEIQYQGWMDIREGAAAFDKFPYPFGDLSGRVYVDNTKIQISDVRGVSPNGATIAAHGVIAPPNEDPRVDIYVQVRGAPVDQTLKAALGPGRDEVLTTLFNDAEYQELLDRGLVLSPDLRDRLVGDLADAQRRGDVRAVAELQGRLRTPVFRFGGSVNVDVHVHRPEGLGQDWFTNIEVRLPEAGLVPERFPIPVHAYDLVCKITDDSAELVSGRFEGLRGGEGSVTASLTLPPSKAPDTPLRPDVRVTARGVPLDDLLIHALPGEDRAGSAANPKPLKHMLTDLGLSGLAQATVRIAPRDVLGRPGAVAGPTDDVGYDADVTIMPTSLAPMGGPVLLKGLSGDLHVTEEDLRLTAAGVPANDRGKVTLEITSRFNAPGGVAVDCSILAVDLDTALPVERAVQVFSEPAAVDMAALRDLYKPTGTCTSETSVTIRQATTQDVLVTIRDADQVSLDLFGGRATLGDSTGLIRVKTLEGPTVQYEDFRTAINFNGVDSGVFTINGSRRYRLRPDQVGPAMTVEVEGAPFGTPMVPAVLTPGMGAERMAGYSSLNPDGLFDATIRIAGLEPLRVDAFSGTIRPRTLSLDLSGQRLALDSFTGSAEFNGATGRFHRLTGANGVWQATADGTWAAEAGGVRFDLDLTASGTSVTPDLLAVLPATLQASLAFMLVKVEGPFDLSESHLRWLVGAGLERDTSTFTGLMEFQDASLVAGMTVDHCDGRMDIDYHMPPAGKLPTFRVALVADSLNLSLAPCTDTRAVIQNGHVYGETLVPLLTGQCLGGRFSGQVRVSPIGDTLAKEYWSEFQIAGVEFGPLLRSFVPAPPGINPAEEPPRGRLDANLAIGGIVDQPTTRRGQGSMRVAGEGSRVLDFPLVVSLVEVSNLQLPGNADLDFAQGMFYIDGGKIMFEDLSVYSQAVEIRGFGTVSWPEMEMDLRFDSSSARPVPVLSWLVEGIRDRLVTTRVSGTPGAPIIRVEAMPTTRESLARAMGVRGAGSRQIEEMERRAAQNRRTIRPTRREIAAEDERK